MKTLTAPKASKNNPAKAGKNASKVLTFGEDSRYAVKAVHTRFDVVAWFVTDANQTDAKGLAEVIRQAETFEGAVQGLLDPTPSDDAVADDDTLDEMVAFYRQELTGE